MILAGIAALLLSRQAPFPKDLSKGIIEDFESGSFANWKVTGSFGRANLPTNAAEFKVRYKSTPIANFEGKFFALSLDRSNSEIGKAVSPSFEIPKDWSQISFDILGGNDPAKTAFRLIRDDNGSTVRTASGDGTLTFVRKSWNVADLRGKSVHLEMEDSATGNYGFIGLDNILGVTEAAFAKENVKGDGIESSGEAALLSAKPAARQILNYFQKNAYDRRIETRCTDAYKISDSQAISLINKFTSCMIDRNLDLYANLTPPELANRILKAFNKFIAAECPDANKLFRDRLLMQGLYDWTRTHYKYNRKLNQEIMAGRVDRELRKKYWTPSSLFKMEAPNAVCAGFANTLQEMGRSLGLNCFCVNGGLRSNLRNDTLALTAKDETGHKWVMLKSVDGYIDCFDSSRGAVDLNFARQQHSGLFEPVTSPITASDWALHFAVYKATVSSVDYKILPLEETLSSVPYETWRTFDVSALRGLPFSGKWYETAVVNWDFR